jgi:hypothetical protein
VTYKLLLCRGGCSCCAMTVQEAVREFDVMCTSPKLGWGVCRVLERKISSDYAGDSIIRLEPVLNTGPNLTGTGTAVSRYPEPEPGIDLIPPPIYMHEDKVDPTQFAPRG